MILAEDFVDYIKQQLDGRVFDVAIVHGHVELTTTRNDIMLVLRFLRDNIRCQFTQLSDICGVDYPARNTRFEVVYHLLSYNFHSRVRVKVPVNDGESIESVCSIFECANWFERECWDMFGIVFDNHPDLRRILTDFGFEGFPLRKDFPLEGEYELFYDEVKHKVEKKEVCLPQSYRDFNTSSAWSLDERLEEYSKLLGDKR